MARRLAVTQDFFSAEECQVSLAETLGADAGGQRGRAAEEVAAALVQDMARGARAQDADDFEFKVGSWAIRDDELDVLGIIKDGVLAYLDSKPGTWINLAVTLARQVLALYRKGVRLTREQASALTELRRHREARPAADIAAALGWPEHETTVVLEALAVAPARAGAVKLAEKRPDGGWIAHA
jgi:hypothetical protein